MRFYSPTFLGGKKRFYARRDVIVGTILNHRVIYLRQTTRKAYSCRGVPGVSAAWHEIVLNQNWKFSKDIPRTDENVHKTRSLERNFSKKLFQTHYAHPDGR